METNGTRALPLTRRPPLETGLIISLPRGQSAAEKLNSKMNYSIYEQIVSMCQ
jgi:hypothetical protein